jgi:catechol 2,3-dioxygenase-like lactoylglutathione lyase family enzyme
MNQVQSAEVGLPSTDLAADLAFYVDRLGFRLETIFPADRPAIALLSGYGLRLRLATDANSSHRAGSVPAVLRLLCSFPESVANGEMVLIAPNGVRIELVEAHPRPVPPVWNPEFIVHRLGDEASWGIGRAGMHYRDLIPGRLGGHMIASHIRIRDAGPVLDQVHYHTIGFQLIFCHHGWVRLVYEDQGPPFILRAGDCVIQPPQIRHRVLESSANLHVVEIGVPAEHLTTMDHELGLPSLRLQPERRWNGQRFCHSELETLPWRRWRLPGFEARDTGIGAATGGMAGVHVARPVAGVQAVATRHSADLLFTFVLSGTVMLHGDGQLPQRLAEADAYVVPPGMATELRDCSADLSLLEVSLPGHFATAIHSDVSLT